MINRAGAELLGFAGPGELEGRDWFALAIPDEEREMVRDVHAAVIAGDRSFSSHENAVATRPGERRIVAWRNALVKDGEGRVTGTLSSGIDVTELARAQQRLRPTNWALRVIGGGNQAVVPSFGEREILDEVCRVAVEEGGYRAAWIGLLEGDGGGGIEPVAAQGEEVADFEAIDHPSSGKADLPGLVEEAVRSRVPAIVCDLAGAPGDGFGTAEIPLSSRATGPGPRSR